MKLENLTIGKYYKLLNYFPFPKNHIEIYFKFKKIEIVDENYCYVYFDDLIFQDSSDNTFSKSEASSIFLYKKDTNKSYLFSITKREYYSVIRKYIIYEIKGSIR